MRLFSDCATFFLVNVLAISRRTSAQVPSWGSCPTIDTMQDFDVNRYMGRWFKITGYEHFFELGLSCITADYFINSSESPPGLSLLPVITVKNRGHSQMHNEEVVSDGTAYHPAEIGPPSKLKLHFPNVTGAGTTAEDSDYWVLDTDYNTFAVVWSCIEMKIFGASFINAQMLWILGRNPILPETTIEVVKERIKAHGLNPGHLPPQDPGSCPEHISKHLLHEKLSRRADGWNLDSYSPIGDYPPNLFSANFFKATQHTTNNQ